MEPAPEDGAGWEHPVLSTHELFVEGYLYRVVRERHRVRCSCTRRGETVEVEASGPAADQVSVEQIELIAQNLWRASWRLRRRRQL